MSGLLAQCLSLLENITQCVNTRILFISLNLKHMHLYLKYNVHLYLEICSEFRKGHLLEYHVILHTLPSLKPLLSHSPPGPSVDRRIRSVDQSVRRLHPRLTEALWF